jgi:hypothetical protein
LKYTQGIRKIHNLWKEEYVIAIAVALVADDKRSVGGARIHYGKDGIVLLSLLKF